MLLHLLQTRQFIVAAAGGGGAAQPTERPEAKILFLKLNFLSNQQILKFSMPGALSCIDRKINNKSMAFWECT